MKKDTASLIWGLLYGGPFSKTLLSYIKTPGLQKIAEFHIRKHYVNSVLYIFYLLAHVYCKMGDSNLCEDLFFAFLLLYFLVMVLETV